MRSFLLMLLVSALFLVPISVWFQIYLDPTSVTADFKQRFPLRIAQVLIDLVLFGIAASAVASIVFDALGRSSDKYAKEVKDDLCELFECNYATDESVAIVIASPSKDHIQLESATQQDSAILQDENETYRKLIIKRLIRFGELTFDIVAMSYIISAFSKAGLPVPQIMTDSEALEELNKKEKSKIKAFIAVGLFTNSLTLHVNRRENMEESWQTEGARLFEVETKVQYHREPDEASFAKLKIKIARLRKYPSHLELLDSEQWDRYPLSWNFDKHQPTSDQDFGLFAKFPYRDSQAVFVVGAMTKKGSQRLGKFFSESWREEIYPCVQVFKKEGNLPKNPFAMVFSVPLKGEKSKIELEKSCPR